MIESITNDGQLHAIIISSKFCKPGTHFFTPDDYSQQLAFISLPVGKEIPPHIHNFNPRHVHFTQEVLFIRKGKLRVDFYDENHNYLESRILEAGDVILIATGGHGFEILEELEMFEVKQGPYSGDCDRTRFNAVDSTQLKVVK